MSDKETDQNIKPRCPQCGAELPGGGLAGLCPSCLLHQAAADTATQPEIPGFQPPGVAEMAALFPHLEILSLIGRGGMGAVYKARQPLLDRLVAVKILPAQVTRGTDFADRFTREARALARLHHPNIVMVYDFGQMNGQPYFVMEYVDGLNLRQLEQEGKLTPAEALQIVPQICEALQFAHDAGIVHRDIKPDNILLDKKGRVKIADFGIAKIIGAGADPAIPVTQGAIGTPHYMAPEQVERPQSVDHRADIFSLGVVFYEMLTGELPLGKFGPPSSGPKGLRVDVRLDEVVFRALEREPDRRYQHASQVKTAVETIAGSLPPGAFPAGFGTPVSGLASEAVLARDYQLGIRSCLHRAWALVRSHFWPLVGMTALILALIGVATSTFVSIGNTSKTTFDGFSALALLLNGPLLGGLYLYFLKKIRGEPATVEIAFSGFGKRFLHLFLANFVVSALTILGLICFVLPGIYLWVAWIFTLMLVIDQGLDFWPAMELSRKVVQRHWWKVLLLLAAFLALVLMGMLACFIGVFLTAPVAIATLAYAYEDIFGPRSPAPAARPLAVPSVPPAVAPAPAAAFGPAGTLVVPNAAEPAAAAGLAGASPAAGGAAPPKIPPPPAPGIPPAGIPPRRPLPPRPTGGFGKWIFIFGLIALLGLLFLIAVVALLPSFHRKVGDAFVTHKFGSASVRISDDQPSAAAEPIPPIPPLTPLTPLPAVAVRNPAAQALADRLRLELAKVSLGFDDFAVAATNNTNLLVTFTGLQKLAPAGTISSSAGIVVSNGNEVVSLSPSHGIQIVDKNDHNHTSVSIGGLHIGINETQTSSGPAADGSLLGSPGEAGQWKFIGNGQLAPVSFLVTNLDEAAVLAASVPNAAVASGKSTGDSPEVLGERLEAAQNISDETVKDKALAAVSEDAAKSDNLEMVKAALQQVSDGDTRNAAALADATLLAQVGDRKAALEIAQSITDSDVRDQALIKLAQ